MKVGSTQVHRPAHMCVAFASLLFSAVVLVSCRDDETAADLIFHGGNILTMADGSGVVEAVAVDGGRIRAVGSTGQVMKLKDSHTVIVDLEGRTLVPGFIDAHGHFTEVVRIIDDTDIQSPPAGPVSSIKEIIDALEKKIELEEVRPEDWVVGTGYDELLLDEARHPTWQDLDRVSMHHPVLAVHASGRMGSLNSRALEIAEISRDSPDPEGGVIERRPGTREPTGLIRERAFFRIRRLIERDAHPRELIDRVRRAGEYYASFGITTTQDGATRESGFRVLAAAAQSGSLPIDVVCYGDPGSADGFLRKWSGYRDTYNDGLRIGGITATLDGPPERGEAWFTEPYAVPPPGREPDFTGEPKYANDNEVSFLFHSFMSQGVQVVAHVNGDAAADQMITAVENAMAMIGPGDLRPVMSYAHTVREDQLDRMAALGIVPSFFTGQLYFRGDLYLESMLGKERSDRLSPCRSALQRGMYFSIHNDEPDVPPNVLFLIGNAVNRLSRNGRVIGADQRIDAVDALKAVTIWAARQIFEEDSKGSLEVGKLADLVILSDNPLDVAPDEIGQLAVVATFKEGSMVYRAP